jgi:hypothetical protein
MEKFRRESRVAQRARLNQKPAQQQNVKQLKPRQEEHMHVIANAHLAPRIRGNMKKLYELHKTFDLEPFQAGDGDEFRFRLEVLQEVGTNSFHGKVYRRETYRLQPTFPLSDGDLQGLMHDALILVDDDMFVSEAMQGSSSQDVVQKFQAIIQKTFGT